MKATLFIEQNKLKVDENRTLVLELADGKRLDLYRWFVDFYEVMNLGMVFVYGLIVMGLFVLQNQMSASASNFMFVKDLGLIVLAVVPFLVYKYLFYKTKHNYHFLSNPSIHFVFMFASLILVSIVYYLIGNDLSFLINNIISLITPQNSILNLSTPLNISINP